MLLLISAFLVAAIANLLIIRFAHLNRKLIGDYLPGPQKMHDGIVPRIGGLGIFCGMLAAAFLLCCLPSSRKPDLLFMLLITASPAFVAGLVEDFTKRISPFIRLLFAVLSAGLGIVFLGAVIFRVGIRDLNELFAFWPLAFVFTVFAVTGMVQAVNIVDGFNGLSSGVALLVLFALAYVAFRVHGVAVLHICLAASGAVLGLLIWNYPAGLVFLGDGGAYLIGVVIAEAAIMLVARHPQVSPWFPLLVVIYPVFETLFSMYRRVFLRHTSPAAPDALHLHSLVYRRLLGWMLSSKLEAGSLVRRNAMTTPYLWGLTLLCIIPAVIFYNRTYVLMAGVALFIVSYLWVYSRIVRFRSPEWIRRLFELGHRQGSPTQ